MNNQPKRFHIGDVLSMTTGRLLCPTGVEGLYAIAKHLTGEDIYTRQLPRVFREAQEPLLQQFPFLRAYDGEDITQENYQDWLAARVAEFGEHLEVAPLSADEHRRIGPITELVEMLDRR